MESKQLFYVLRSSPQRQQAGHRGIKGINQDSISKANRTMHPLPSENTFPLPAFTNLSFFILAISLFLFYMDTIFSTSKIMSILGIK